MIDDPNRLRAALMGMRDAARRVVADYPGSVVLYDPTALADALDAILDNGDTSATNDAAMARGAHMAAAVDSGRFRLLIIAPNVSLVDPKGKGTK